MSNRRVNQGSLRRLRSRQKKSKVYGFEHLENRELLAADFEPNDTFIDAFNLGSGSQFHTDPQITGGDKADIYRWTASVEGTLRVDVLFNHAEVDLEMTIYNGSQQELGRFDTITSNERGSVPISPGAQFFIEVKPFFEGRTGPYDLRITEIGRDAFDSASRNDSIGTATDLGSSNVTHTKLNIDRFGDRDLFRWTAPATGFLTAAAMFDHDDGDLDVIIRDSSGNQLGSSESITDDELAKQQVMAGQTYYVDVFEANGREVERYDLSVEFVAPPTLSSIGFTFAPFNSPTTIPITVGDNDDPLDSLVFIGASSDQRIVPNRNIVFGGSGSSRTVTITPLEFGTTDIAIMVNDLNGGVAEQTFTFAAFNNRPAPVISEISNQTISEDGSTGAISFLLNDADTAFNNLTVTASSSDPELIPSGNIAINQADPISTVTITPAANRVGTAEITLTATDSDGGQGFRTFTVTVTPVDDGGNDPPTFDPISDQTMAEDSGSRTISITGVGPGGSGEGGQTVTLSATSSNPFLVSPSISGSTLTLTPGANRNGTAKITVQATDNGGGVNTFRRTFNVTVTDVNDPPSMSRLFDLAVDGDSASQTFTVTDLETPPSFLSINASSNNASVVPSSNISISPTGMERTLEITSGSSAGSADITVTVSDGSASVSDTFEVSVSPSNTAPTLTDFVSRTINEDSGTGTISFGVSDDQTPATSLMVTASSSNSAPLPNANISLGGTGSSRSLSAVPVANQFGSTVITVTVSDGTQSTTKSFSLTVNSVNDPPSFTKGPDQTVFENSGSQVVPGWATNISPGPANESVQTFSFNVTGNSNPALFASGPVISSNGQLSFTPATNVTGSATLTVVVVDNGGTANGGVNTSAKQTFTINVGAINDAPSFTKGPNQTVFEDAGPQTIPGWATNITPGPADESGQAVNFVVTANSNPGLFSQPPAVSPTGQLTFTPAAHQHGSSNVTIVLRDDGGTQNGGVDSSAPVTFLIQVASVNDAPTFVKGPDQTTAENAGPQTIAGWATGISAGPANEANQTLTFNITDNTNPGLFAAGPAISPNGQLTYTPAANAAGVATLTVVLTDSGGTDNGGTNVSPPRPLTISIGAVNDPPSFTKGADQTVLEDAGPQVVDAWATNISPGPANESGQTVAFQITGNTNPALFAEGPALSPTGQLTYTPAANANGSAVIAVVAQDNGGTNGGGVDTSAPQSFTIQVTPVNDAPTFTKGADQTLSEGAGAQSVPGWATNISAGAPNESSQTLTFNVTDNTNPSLFTTAPAISADGTLTYTMSPQASGTATISFNLMDDGGTDNGGVNTSATESFTISITGVNDPPTFTPGIDQTVREDAGPVTVPGWATDIDPGAEDEANQTLTFNISGNSNPGLFSAGPAISPTGDLSYTVAANAHGSAVITVILMDDGGTQNGGDDTSDPRAFSIAVTSVNDAPSFTKGDDVTVPEESGTQTLAGWATDISAGPANESDQSLNFIVTGNSNTALFAVGPAISPDGQLTFTPAAGASGSANVTVVLADNGGTVNGGQDRSAPQMFTINVSEVNAAPTISEIADQTLALGSSSDVLNFTIGDDKTAVEGLTVTASSSDGGVVPAANIQIGGVGAVVRTVQVTPVAVGGPVSIFISVNDGTQSTVETFMVTVVDTTAPTVTSAVRNDGAQLFNQLNSLSYTFSEDVSATLDKNDLSIVNLNTLSSVSLAAASVSWDAATRTARFDLSAIDFAVSRYLVTLKAAGLTDTDGNQLDGNADGEGGDDRIQTVVVTFTGDADRDLDVDFSDFLALSANFGLTGGRTWAQGDFNNDQQITFADFLELSANFGKQVEVPTLAQADLSSLPSNATSTNTTKDASSTTKDASGTTKSTSGTTKANSVFDKLVQSSQLSAAKVETAFDQQAQGDDEDGPWWAERRTPWFNANSSPWFSSQQDPWFNADVDTWWN